MSVPGRFPAGGIENAYSEGRTIISYQRDRFVPTEELSLPYWDDVSGTLRGYRVFTACRTVREKIFRLEDHLRRLYDSAAGIHMVPPMGQDALRDILMEAVRLNRERDPHADLLLNVIFSGGLQGCTMKQSGAGAHLYIAAQPLITPDAECYEKGVALATFAYQRMYPAVKLLNYVGAIIAHQLVVPRHDAYDVVFVCPEDGNTILEGSTFTVFFVDSDGVILTPPLDGKILDSITRRVVIEILGGKPEFRLRETPVRMGEVASFREAFIASTTRNVLSVTRLNDLIIGNGTPGPVTRSVHDVFEAYLRSY
ncbi:MAG: aminotransferase class IV [Desulfomonilaceae bacterium]|nr:aminotransferase class IV [Desulfomonilaceae bacterium]